MARDRRYIGHTVITGPEWQRTIEALRRVDAEFPHRLKDKIKEDAEELADVAKGRVLGLPTPAHAGHTGLREKVAAGVQVIDTPGGGVRVVTEMPTPSEGIIPRGLDRLKGWRHPLFGDKSHWYSNPGYDWFLSTFERGKSHMKGDLTKVLEKGLKDVADAAGFEA